ncbi:MAG: CPBP family intramembrane metalloprotease [Clostridiales bacterium]|jgi:membrane protease YdiL (CAAX protease family)|nr:CPBP family intramembrane metalloprotease [Clostridiales bacterium]
MSNRKSLTLGESNVSLLSALGGMTAAALLMMSAVFIYSAATDGKDLSATSAYVWLTYGATQAFMIIGAAFYLLVLRKANILKLFDFGASDLTPQKTLLLPFISVGAILAFSPLADLFLYVLSLIGYNPAEQAIFPEGISAATFLLMTFFVAVIPAVFEEILFRGALLNGARRRGSFFAVIYTAAIFMIFHGNPMQTVHQFLLGLVLGYVAVTTGKIVYGVILHFLNNLIALLTVFIPFGGMTVTGLAVMYVIWIIAGAFILTVSLKTFKKLNDADIQKRCGLIDKNQSVSLLKELKAAVSGLKDTARFAVGLLVKGGAFKAAAEEFNAKYDPLNKFDEEIGNDVIFIFEDKNGDKNAAKLPASTWILTGACALLWLTSFVLGFFGA